MNNDDKLNKKTKNKKILLKFIPLTVLTLKLFSSCTEPFSTKTLPTEGSGTIENLITNQKSVYQRIEEESSMELSESELSDLENIITSYTSGHTTYSINLPFTLKWDGSGSPVKEYNLYFRERYANKWIRLAKTANTHFPEFTVNNFPYGLPTSGVYEFAVSAVDFGSKVSELHTSTDSNSQPSNGWYVFLNTTAPADSNEDKIVSTDELVDHIMTNGFLSRVPNTEESRSLTKSIDNWYSNEN